MQTELFERNALTLLGDNMQKLLYGDILTANGFSAKHIDSIAELMQAVTHDTDLVMLNVDGIEKNTLLKLSDMIKKKNSRTPLIGLTIQRNSRYWIDFGIFAAVIGKPAPIDLILKRIFSAFSTEAQDSETVSGTNPTCLLAY